MEKRNNTHYIPVLALRNLVPFPGVSVPLRVGRTQSVAALKAAIDRWLKMRSSDGTLIKVQEDAEGAVGAELIAVFQRDNLDADFVREDDVCAVGVRVKIDRLRGNDKDGYHILIRGIDRVQLSGLRTTQSNSGFEYLSALAEPIQDVHDADEATLQTLLESMKTLSKQILNELPAAQISGTGKQLEAILESVDSLEPMINLAAANLDIPLSEKQSLLEATGLKKRALRLLELMQKTRDELQIQSEIRGKVNSKLGKNQREAILREQLRAIQDELGDLDETSSDGKKPDQYRQKITASQMPEAVRKTALDELRRLESMGNQSPETHVIRNYLDLLLALPWSMGEGDHANLESEIDLNKARQVLDDDHYGLDKIKKRIIEHLATMKLRPEKRGLILLFNGPPGVGKTSLGQSIAKALGRKFVRASLGGVRDDAEIRGHRRTYVGAMPGRIIQSLKRVGTVNPVFLLDEIDKLGRGYSGDPASALLEVLDPEQNATFTDHYLDVPYDLSKVLFIATANSLETIPGPLLDRMEVIELTGYTTNEKVHIAKSHLLPKELAEHGITSEQLTISDETLGKVIAQYTREAGVRDLQRKISALCRNVAIQIVEGKATVEVNDVLVEEALGASRFESEAAAVVMPPGVATGLAWTPVGGEILFIESALMPGHGKLSLTGQLGDVMKESAQIALTLVRSRLPAVSSKLDFEKNDVHIHVPAGAIPKDGPSAGVAILTSIASLFLGRAVDAKLAMTGEITLRGSVTPVGGIKEKVIAAHRAGMKRIILARRNERDLRDVPAEVRAGLEFIFADDVADVLRAALGLELAEMDQGTGLWNLATAVGIGSVAAGTAPESGAL